VDAIWAAIIPVCVSIVGGGLAISWKLGGLDTSVKNMDDRLEKVEAAIARRRA
jgi:hypothetical protein